MPAVMIGGGRGIVAAPEPKGFAPKRHFGRSGKETFKPTEHQRMVSRSEEELFRPRRNDLRDPKPQRFLPRGFLGLEIAVGFHLILERVLLHTARIPRRPRRA